MQIRRLLRVTSFRLALLQTALLLAMFVGAGTAALVVVRHAESQAVDAEITAEVDDLDEIATHGGVAQLQAMIEARQRDPSIWEFRVEDARRVRLSGDLPARPYPDGWSTERLIEGDKPGNASELVRSFTKRLPNGLRLTVGEDIGAREAGDNAQLGAIAGIAALAAVLGLIVGGLAGRRLLRRLDQMVAVVDRFAAGETGARIATPATATSDLDRLALALNRMMERTTRSMAGMRQVSADIAHDLRRPLARHNQHIARVLRGPPSVETYGEALAAAAYEIDEVLVTFQALLQIAELEAGAPGLELSAVNIADVAARVVDAYGPVAEEGGRALVLLPLREAPQGVSASPSPVVLGEPHLIGRMLANLIENALAHTPVGTRVEVEVLADGPKLVVRDNGQGVPPSQRSRIFERFVRLDSSRAGPGVGLGLALASAVVTVFNGRLTAEDACPGLEVTADFGPSAELGD
jgi:signal transduction histidine kinase